MLSQPNVNAMKNIFLLSASFLINRKVYDPNIPFQMIQKILFLGGNLLGDNIFLPSPAYQLHGINRKESGNGLLHFFICLTIRASAFWDQVFKGDSFHFAECVWLDSGVQFFFFSKRLNFTRAVKCTLLHQNFPS